MDNSNSSSSDEQAAEKRMKVDESAATAGDVTPCGDGKDSNGSAATTGGGESQNASNLNAAAAASVAVALTESAVAAALNEAIVPGGTEAKGSEPSASSTQPEEDVEVLKVVFNKKQLAIKISLNKTVGDLKKLIEAETKIAPALQKVLIKGIPKDEVILKSLGVTSSTKIMVIGTTLDDVMSVSKAPDKEALAAEESNASKDSSNWCSMTQHKKIIDKGVPDDVMPGILGETEPLPEFPLFGMVSSRGSKVRLTFKLESDELWIGTKERTEKISIGTIRNVVSQPITGYEHYHIMAIQLGPTEASRFFVYWVPAQYVESIKDALGV